jgi:RecA-family ATPase
MRFASISAGVVLAVSLTGPVFSAPNDSSNAKVQSATTSSLKKPAVQPLKQPTWEQCYAMSRQRSFDHDIDEWYQSIEDCQEGKIPL